MEVKLAYHAATEANDELSGRAADQPLSVALDVGHLERADLATIDALARIALEVRRGDGRVQLRGACPELSELIELAGLRRVLR